METPEETGAKKALTFGHQTKPLEGIPEAETEEQPLPPHPAYTPFTGASTSATPPSPPDEQMRAFTQAMADMTAKLAEARETIQLLQGEVLNLKSPATKSPPPNGPAPTKTNSKAEKPRSFHGTGGHDAFIEWLSHFEKVAKHNGWDETEKCDKVALHLTDKAARFYDSLKWEVQADWTDLREHLIHRFKGSRDDWQRHLRLEWNKSAFDLQAGADIDTFADQLRWIAHERKMPDTELIAHFSEVGMKKSPQLQADLAMHPAATYEAAVTRARSYFTIPVPSTKIPGELPNLRLATLADRRTPVPMQLKTDNRGRESLEGTLSTLPVEIYDSRSMKLSYDQIKAHKESTGEHICNYCYSNGFTPDNHLPFRCEKLITAFKAHHGK